MRRKGIRVFSVLLAVMLVSAVVMPVMACVPGTSCDNAEQDIKKTELSGLKKYESVASALNLNDVRKLSEIPRSEDMGKIVENAEAFSFEKQLEDGTVKEITAVVLPIESVVGKNGSAQLSNVVAVWDSDNTRVLKSTYTFQDKSLNKLTFSIIDSNGDVLEEVIIDDGSFVEGMPEHLFGTAEDPSYWECVAGCFAVDCACAIGGIACPGPPICDVCIILVEACVALPNPYTCGAAVICFGADVTWCMVSCL